MNDDKRLQSIEEKLDDLSDDQAHMNVLLSAQNQILEEHQRRSLANEEAVKILADQLKPVLLYSEMAKLVVKTLMAVAVSAEGLHLLYGYLK